MFARTVAAAALGAAVLAAAAHGPAAAQPRTALKSEQAELAAAFARMKPQIGGNGAKVLGPVVAANDAERYGNIVKVWANLYDRDGLGNPKPPREARLTTHPWVNQQQFKYAFESLVDVYFYLYSVEKDDTGKESLVQILPQDKYARSKDVIPSGKDYELPVLMEHDARTSNTIEMHFIPKANIPANQPPAVVANNIKGGKTKVLGPVVADDNNQKADYSDVRPDAQGLPQPIKVRLTLQSKN